MSYNWVIVGLLRVDFILSRLIFTWPCHPLTTCILWTCRYPRPVAGTAAWVAKTPLPASNRRSQWREAAFCFCKAHRPAKIIQNMQNKDANTKCQCQGIHYWRLPKQDVALAQMEPHDEGPMRSKPAEPPSWCLRAFASSDAQASLWHLSPTLAVACAEEWDEMGTWLIDSLLHTLRLEDATHLIEIRGLSWCNCMDRLE